MSMRGDVTRLSSRGQVVIPAPGETAGAGPAASLSDLVALLSSFAVSVHAPDVEVARRVAALAAWPEASVADRFAAATAEHLGARLYTTDGVLATAARRHGLACTLL